VLALRLAELHYGVPGLGDRLLQGEDSEDRIVVGADERAPPHELRAQVRGRYDEAH
jgi:hypothetical protein